MCFIRWYKSQVDYLMLACIVFALLHLMHLKYYHIYMVTCIILESKCFH